MDDFKKYVNYSAKGIHDIFSSPVKRVFYWKEDDYYEGKIFIVYKLNGTFIYQSNRWGCCSSCNKWAWISEGNLFSDINQELFDDFPDTDTDTDTDTEFDYTTELKKVINHEILRFRVARSIEEIHLEPRDGGYQYPDLEQKWNEYKSLI